MGLEILSHLEIIEIMENYISKHRPPEHLREEIDLSYKIEEQSVILFEIRPEWKKPNEKMECNVAKATFVKTSNVWKVFWHKSDQKWHSYTPNPKVNTLKDFLKLVETDKHSCFWG